MTPFENVGKSLDFGEFTFEATMVWGIRVQFHVGSGDEGDKFSESTKPITRVSAWGCSHSVAALDKKANIFGRVAKAL